MREVLFRGKRIDNGEWLYGALLPCDDGTMYIATSMLDPPEDGGPAMVACHMVCGNTVGQYTGLTANGKKIFDGDIVRRVLYIGMGYGEAKGEVVYRAPEFLIDCKHHRTMNFSQYPPENGDTEVIGNIHDNPELLEVER